MVIWITGLSGAGKTTIGLSVANQLKKLKHPVVFVDGDDFRAAIDDEKIGHDRQSRIINAKRISKFAKLFEQQNLYVVVSTMSLFHEIHEWNREHLNKYFEVMIQPDLNHLKSNDEKKLYSRAMSGEIKNVVGHDIFPEEPKSPDLVILNNHSETPEALAAAIISNALKNN